LSFFSKTVLNSPKVMCLGEYNPCPVIHVAVPSTLSSPMVTSYTEPWQLELCPAATQS
jgi:hypothetical protein